MSRFVHAMLMTMELIATLPWLTIHVTSVIVTLFFVVVADLHGARWLLGRTPIIPHKRMQRLHRLVWIGLAVTIVAGFVMFINYPPEYLLSLMAFRLKLFFVLGLCINAFIIGRHLEVASRIPFAMLPRSEKQIIIASGVVSTVCWIGALIAAQFIA